jgi:hypothetical protein
MVLHSDGVALLDGWRHSKGALAERALARAAGIPARPLALWLADGPSQLTEGSN